MAALHHEVVRLGPAADLRSEIENLAAASGITAGYVAACVGSLETVSLRMAGANETYQRSGHFEIVSLTGTVSSNGCHLHMAVSDESGNTTGGHLTGGNIVRTTAELIVAVIPGKTFRRVFDEETGFDELQIDDVTRP